MTGRPRRARAASVLGLAMLVACAGRPVADWQLTSKAAMDRSVAAYLSGDAALATEQFELARREIARTGRADLLVRIELIRCAARVASLQYEACEGFEKLRPEAAAPERAYADFLAAKLVPQDIDLLPQPQRSLAAAGSSAEAAAAELQRIEDPFSRLVAAAVLFESGRASPLAISTAVDTASGQGWRRPLLAWLNVQALGAEKAGAHEEAERLRKRIGLVQDSK